MSTTVLEKEGVAGGRAWEKGSPREAVAHVLDAEARSLSGLARAAGLEVGLLPLEPVATARWVAGRVEALPAWRSREAPRLVERLRLARLERVEGRFRALLQRASSEEAARLDDRSIAELARLYLPRSALAGWVEPLTALWSLGDPARASRVALMRLHAAGALAGGRPRLPLRALATALAARLDVQLGCGAAGVEVAGAALRVRLSDGRSLEADAVVVATPPRAARELAEPLLTPPEHEILAAARMAPAITLLAALEKPLGHASPIRVAFAERDGLPLALLLHDSGWIGGNATVHLLANPAWSAAHLEAPDEAIEKELLAALARVHPDFEPSVRATRVARYGEAFPLFPVGRYRELARLRRVLADRRSLGRRLYLVGDWLAGPTAEDAAASGLRAAEEVLADGSPRASSRRS